MKTHLLLFTIFACMVLLTGTVYGQLNGTKTIDPAGSGADNYVSFTAAISDLNTNGVGSGGVTFLIANGTYNESQVAINILSNVPTASTPVIFKPAPGATVIWNIGGQNTTNRFGLRMGDAGGADYVTLDGSNTNGGTSRDWTITASDASFGLEPIDIWSDNVTIKNCVISCSASLMSGSSYGITIREAAPTALNCRIENNKVTSNNAISVGRTTTITISGTVIRNNEVHSYNRGIYAYSVSALTIQNNEIVGDAYAGYPSSTCYGVYTFGPANNTGSIVISGNTLHNFGSNSGITASQTIHVLAAYGSAYYTISNNKIYNLYNATSHITTAVGLHGIYLSGGTTNVTRYEIFNNFITGFLDNDGDLDGNWTAGIRTNTVGRVNIYNNTVYIEASLPVRQHSVAALQLGTNSVVTNDSVFVTNNIFLCMAAGYSGTYKSHALYVGGSFKSFLVSDYNSLYNAGGDANSYIASSTSLATWQATTGNANIQNNPDMHSASMSVNFVDNTTDLHLTGASLGDLLLTGTPNLGWTVPGLPLDIDGETRNATSPYMGADENTTFPLPVELTSFTAQVNGKSVRLLWSTATEVNNYGFEVEKKENTTWQKVGFVEGHGTTNAPQSYSFVDANAAGKVSYRLKQIDRDGKFEYSNAVEVTSHPVANEFRLYGNYPNPFNPSTTIRFSVANDAQTVVRVFNAIGQEVATLFNGVAVAGEMHEIAFDASSLPSGLYFSRLESNGRSVISKMMLLK